MTDIVAIKRLKNAYDNLDLILDFYNTKIDEEKIKNINKTIDTIKELYNMQYEFVKNNDKKSLLSDRCCRNCSDTLLISDLIDYDYLCEFCDENYYTFETYSIEMKKENMKEPSSFDLN